ncbi:MAG: hypothetical protein BWZ10_01116 [candidate division BRC1 bacterium ADurb.BinA364]|nr:MAG: hypothetical protein BWZ10_01116 [candidate division BRC1 bacterium ADurb.BinA364]
MQFHRKRIPLGQRVFDGFFGQPALFRFALQRVGKAPGFLLLQRGFVDQGLARLLQFLALRGRLQKPPLRFALALVCALRLGREPLQILSQISGALFGRLGRARGVSALGFRFFQCLAKRLRFRLQRLPLRLEGFFFLLQAGQGICPSLHFGGFAPCVPQFFL